MVFDEVFDHVRGRRPEDPREVVTLGVAGLTGSGKTKFSEQFSSYLDERAISAVSWHCDSYHVNSREKRDTIRSEVDRLEKETGRRDPNWMPRAYPSREDLMLHDLISIKRRENFSRPELFNSQTGNLDLTMGVNFFDDGKFEVRRNEESTQYENPMAWFLFDCAYVGSDPIREQLDLLLFLGAERETRIGRVIYRCEHLEKPFTPKRKNIIEADDWVQRDYGTYEDIADIVIDNNDYDNRRIVRIND